VVRAAARYCPSVLDPREAIDRINRAYGSHGGHRALHAHGSYYSGTFTGSPEARRLCRAAAFSGEPVPVLVRWSNAAGDPGRPDKAPDIRGMAVKIQAPGGDLDLVTQTQPRFPVRTPEDFVSLTQASQRRLRLPLWLLRHPSALPALREAVRTKAAGSPFSYAELAYYAIHAFGWLDADGDRTWVRYQLVPLAARDDRPEGVFDGRRRLSDEMAARLAVGPVRFDVFVKRAGRGDDPHDPMSVWSRVDAVTAGRLEINAPVQDPERDGGPVVFDPTRVTDGIELSDDPILWYRAAAYSESVPRRTAS
jgi:catalase